MNKVTLLGLVCLLFCLPAFADWCPPWGDVSTYSDLVCQLGPFTLEFGDISVNSNMQNPPTPWMMLGSTMGGSLDMEIFDVGVLHSGEFFDMVIPITYIIPPCCTFKDFYTGIADLQGCCADSHFGLDGMTLSAMDFGPGDLSWWFAWGAADYTLPEPASLWLLGAGLAMSAAALRRRSGRSRRTVRLR